MNNMYTVVIFLSENNVEGVPSNWVFKENSRYMCRWPLIKTGVDELIINLETPKDDWETYAVKILCKSSSYEGMVKKRKRARTESDISDSEIEITRNKKRKIRPVAVESDDELCVAENLSPPPSPPSEFHNFFKL